MHDDAELLRRFADHGDQPAFAALVERHVGLVYASALRQLAGSVHRAQDVTQTVFIDLARKAGPLARRADVAGWLYLSTHFAAAKLKRSEQRRHQRESEAHAIHMNSMTDPDDVAAWDRLQPVLDDALRQLGDSDRAIILQRSFQGQRFGEIGCPLGLGENAARMRVERALEKLGAQLRRRGIASTTAALATSLAHPALAAAPTGFASTVTAGTLTALATGSAGAAGGVILTTLLMNKTVVATSAALLLAAVLGLSELHHRRAAASAASAHEGRVAALHADLATIRQRADKAERVRAALADEVQALQATPPAVASAAPVAPQPAVAGVMRFAGNSVQAQSTSLADAMEINYAAFFRQLGLNPQQRAQFTALMLAWKERGNQRLGDLVRAAGGKPAPEALAQYRRETDNERDAQMRSEFGDGVFQAFQQYEAQHPLRRAAEQLAAELFQSDTPVVASQTDQVVAILANHARTPDGRYDLATVDKGAVLAQAQGTLSAPQLRALQRILEQKQRPQVLEAVRLESPRSMQN